MKLPRLGATLRYVNEEVGRFLAHSETFSAKRFVFFTHRAWLLAHGLAAALEEKNDRALARLAGTGARGPIPVRTIDVVTLGVSSRSVQNSVQLRLSPARGQGRGPRARRSLPGARLRVRPQVDGLGAEAYLHLPQPQDFIRRSSPSSRS